MPPSSSGSDVVAAAMIAPESACTRPLSVNADRMTRSVSSGGSFSVLAQSDQYAPARSRRSDSLIVASDRSSVPQRSSSRIGAPSRGRTTARAVSWRPSEVISQSTPGERSTIGSDVPTTRRPSRSRSSRTGTWPNSGRGANVITALVEPLIRRITSVRCEALKWSR